MIETQRLRIIPLTYEQLILYLRCDNSLEKALQLQESKRTLSLELREAFAQSILPNVAEPSRNYLYYTLWTAIDKAEQQMVGDLCFVGEPNAVGEIEVGYGTYDAFRNRGYMTEMVGAMIEWAKTQPKVRFILASTEKSNKASFRVLEKNGFVQQGEDGTLLHWRRVVKRDMRDER